MKEFAPICTVARTSNVMSPAAAQEIPVMSIAARTGLQPRRHAEQNGIRVAMEEANKNGYLGAAKIKLIEGDDGSEKSQAINLADQTIRRDRVVLSLGPTTSPVFSPSRRSSPVRGLDRNACT